MGFGRTVLVVEDSETVREPLCDILERAGYEVLACESGACAVETAKAREIHVVITDFGMPGMDGAAVSRHMRARFPRTFIVGVSAGNKRRDFLAAGADAFLAKPYHFDDILRLLNDRSPWEGSSTVNEQQTPYGYFSSPHPRR